MSSIKLPPTGGRNASPWSPLSLSVVSSAIVSDQQPPIDIKEQAILYYLKELADLGLYGGTAGRVANAILRKEIVSLIGAGVLTKVAGLTKLLEGQAAAKPKKVTKKSQPAATPPAEQDRDEEA
jgi:hypothetical protein